MLTVLTQTEGVNGCGASGVVINGMRCDPATATHVYTSVASVNCVTGDGFHRLDEELYRTPDGYRFLVRPLALDDEEVWLEDEHHDSILARQLFPGDA